MEVETVLGLDNEFGGGWVQPVVVEKVTKVKVYFFNEFYGITYAMRKDTYKPNKDYYYGKKTELFMPDTQKQIG